MYSLVRVIKHRVKNKPCCPQHSLYYKSFGFPLVFPLRLLISLNASDHVLCFFHILSICLTHSRDKYF